MEYIEDKSLSPLTYEPIECFRTHVAPRRGAAWLTGGGGAKRRLPRYISPIRCTLKGRSGVCLDIDSRAVTAVTSEISWCKSFPFLIADSYAASPLPGCIESSYESPGVVASLLRPGLTWMRHFVVLRCA